MQNSPAKAIALFSALVFSAFCAAQPGTLSGFAHAQSQPGKTPEHKQLPPICQGEANRFNCASATVEGQTDAPAIDSWGRPVTPPSNAAKSAPAPRHDISGIWQVEGIDEFGFRGIIGVFGAPALPSDGYPNHEPPYTKEGLEAYHRHKPVFGVDAVPAAQSNDPVKSCDPPGFPRSDLHSLSTFQIFQTQLQVVVLYARYKNWRMIWTDGRDLPKDPDPTWDGYSTGKWVDDTTFVVQTIGTDDRAWIDNAGRPHSDALRVEERFHRVDHDHITLTVTLDDPKMYAKPWVALENQLFRLMPPDTVMAETRCSPSEMAAYDSLISSPIVK